MTEATLSEMTDAMLSYMSEPRTDKEVLEMLEKRYGIDTDLAEAVMLRAAGKGAICIAPGTNARKWTTKARARAALQEAEE